MNTAIEIFGKIYQIKCPESEVHALERAAQYLDEKMRETRDVGNVLSIDRIILITALNIAHQILILEDQNLSEIEKMNKRIHDLHLIIENALTKNAEMELEPAE